MFLVVSTDPLPHAYAEEIRTWQEMADAEVDGMVEAPSPQLPNKEAELVIHTCVGGRVKISNFMKFCTLLH